MVLYFTAVRACQNIPSTLTGWGRGWEIPWALFSNGSLFRNDRTPKLTQKCFYVQKEPQKTTSSWTHKCLRPDRPKNGFTSRWTIKCVHIHGPQSFGFPKSSCESYINMLQYLFVRLFFRGRLICERDHVDN